MTLTNETLRSMARPTRKSLACRVDENESPLIRAALIRSGWEDTVSDEWDLRCTKGTLGPDSYAIRGPGQVFNHFFGNCALGNKSTLHQTLDRAQARLAQRGQEQRYHFHPRTFTLPDDLDALAQEAERRPGTRWVQKPAHCANGVGVEVILSLDGLKPEPSWIVQEYLERPHLLDGFRYTLRLYVLVTSLDPLLVYAYPQGIVKVAAVPYQADRAVTDPFVHLTNTRVVREHAEGERIERSLTLDEFRQKLCSEGIDTESLWARIHRLKIATVIAARDRMLAFERAYAVTGWGDFELFGFDLAIDEDLKPWLLECNLSPSMQLLAIPDTHYAHEEQVLKEDLLGDLATMLHTTALWERSQPPSPNDPLETERALLRAAVELAACGPFQRIYPAADVSEHFYCFPYPRYRDIVLAREECPDFVPETPTLRPRPVREKSDGESLILTTPDGVTFHTLNPTAGYVWAACGDGLTVEDMVEELEEQFPHVVVPFENDVRKALADFLEAGVIDYA